MIANPHVYVIRRARRKFKRLRHKTKGAHSNSVLITKEPGAGLATRLSLRPTLLVA